MRREFFDKRNIPHAVVFKFNITSIYKTDISENPGVFRIGHRDINSWATAIVSWLYRALFDHIQPGIFFVHNRGDITGTRINSLYHSFCSVCDVNHNVISDGGSGAAHGGNWLKNKI